MFILTIFFLFPDLEGRSTIRHCCNCCSETQEIGADIQMFHHLPQLWDKDGDCLHISALKEYLGGVGSFVYRQHLDACSRFQTGESHNPVAFFCEQLQLLTQGGFPFCSCANVRVWDVRGRQRERGVLAGECAGAADDSARAQDAAVCEEDVQEAAGKCCFSLSLSCVCVLVCVPAGRRCALGRCAGGCRRVSFLLLSVCMCLCAKMMCYVMKESVCCLSLVILRVCVFMVANLLHINAHT